MSLKTCSKCGKRKRAESFYRQAEARDGLRPDCIKCFKAIQKMRLANKETLAEARKVNECVDCGKKVYRSSLRCRCCYQLRQDGAEPKWRLHKSGYMVANVKGKTVSQHRYEMERFLGRPLYPGESVHHKNGVRSDNGISNLELWVSTQPSGQRIADLVEWAKVILERYDK